MRTLKSRLFLVLWVVYSSYMTVQEYVTQARIGRGISWAEAFGDQFLYGALWLIFTPLILWLARKIPFRKPGWPLALVVHFILGVLIAVAQAWIYTFLQALHARITRGVPLDFESFFTLLASFFDYGIHLYWLVVALDYVYEYYFIARRHELHTAKLEAQLAGAHLRALTMQVQPHFLFNTLNTISVLIRQEPESARSMVGRLASLLRSSLSVTTQSEITLEKEVEFLENYLEIEKTRFRDRLSITIAVPPETLPAMVPALILQPLVENSVKHGVSKVGGSGSIEVSAARVNGRLRLTVTNSGGGAEWDEAREGVGLSNTRSRLEHLYGDRQEFSLRRNGPGGPEGVTAEILLPFHTEREGG